MTPNGLDPDLLLEPTAVLAQAPRWLASVPTRRHAFRGGVGAASPRPFQQAMGAESRDAGEYGVRAPLPLDRQRLKGPR